MTAYPITYEYGPTHVRASVPALPGCLAVAPTYEQVRVLIHEAIGRRLLNDAPEASSASGISLADQLAFLQRLVLPVVASASPADLACFHAIQMTLRDLLDDGPFGTVFDLSVCPGCDMSLVWTELDGAPMAWSEHVCLSHGGQSS